MLLICRFYAQCPIVKEFRNKNHPPFASKEYIFIIIRDEQNTHKQPQQKKKKLYKHTTRTPAMRIAYVLFFFWNRSSFSPAPLRREEI